MGGGRLPVAGSCAVCGWDEMGGCGRGGGAVLCVELCVELGVELGRALGAAWDGALGAGAQKSRRGETRRLRVSRVGRVSFVLLYATSTR